MKFILIFISAVIIGVGASAQEIPSKKRLQKAERCFKEKKYKVAKVIFEKEALKQKSPSLLHRAALCYQELSGRDYCEYFKLMVQKGMVLSPEELFFYSFDATTYKKIPIH